jgi:hypothetical protein
MPRLGTYLRRLTGECAPHTYETTLNYSTKLTNAKQLGEIGKSVSKERVAAFLDRNRLDLEAKASSQQVRLLTTALLEEVRASSSVGGGGRKRWNLEGKR